MAEHIGGVVLICLAMLTLISKEEMQRAVGEIDVSHRLTHITFI